jgi:clan AA aspartic protease
MTGQVIDGKALVGVVFHLGPKGSRTIEFVIDTGFEGALALPILNVSEMDLPFHQNISARLADDSTCEVDAYRATVHWQGDLLTLAVLAMGERPLLGTTLLDGNDLHIRFDEGGEVITEPIEKS